MTSSPQKAWQRRCYQAKRLAHSRIRIGAKGKPEPHCGCAVARRLRLHGMVGRLLRHGSSSRRVALLGIGRGRQSARPCHDSQQCSSSDKPSLLRRSHCGRGSRILSDGGSVFHHRPAVPHNRCISRCAPSTDGVSLRITACDFLTCRDSIPGELVTPYGGYDSSSGNKCGRGWVGTRSSRIDSRSSPLSNSRSRAIEYCSARRPARLSTLMGGCSSAAT